MSEEAAKYEVNERREPVAVRLLSDVIRLGRRMSKERYGSDKKLGLLIEDAIKFMAASQEDEARATALLDTTEERLIRRISDRFESMGKNLINRIGSLQAISAFEICLTESILKSWLVKTPQDKARYEELRSVAATKMKDRFIKSGAEQLAELYEQNQRQEETIQELRQTIEQYKKALQKANADIENQNITLKNMDNVISKLQNSINENNQLISWYERMETEIPRIQDQNKTLGVKMSYEKAMEIYKQQNPKPSRSGN